jgi:hypothetical protein
LNDAEAYWRELEARFRAAQNDENIEVDFKRFLMLLEKNRLNSSRAN